MTTRQVSLVSKCRVILLFALMIVANAKAQSYHPFLGNSNVWYFVLEFEGCWTDILKTVGDTTFNGQNYKIVQDAHCSGHNSTNLNDSCIVAYIREDTLQRKVFVKHVPGAHPSDTTEFVYYNFNLMQGDSIYLLNPYLAQGLSQGAGGVYALGWYFVDSVSMVQTLVGSRKATYLHYQWDTSWNNCSSKSIWVEGIGEVFGSYLGCEGLNYVYLSCAYRDSVHEYFNPSHLYSDTINRCICNEIGGINELTVWGINLSVYPNPSTDLVSLVVKGEKEMLSASVYDILGKEVEPLFKNQIISSFDFNTQNLDAGLYFVKVINNQSKSIMLKLAKQ